MVIRFFSHFKTILVILGQSKSLKVILSHSKSFFACKSRTRLIGVGLVLISRAFNPSKPLSTRTYQIPDSRLSSIFSAIFSISFCSLVYLLPLKYFFLLSLVSIFPSFHSSVCLISFLYSEAPLQRIRF